MRVWTSITHISYWIRVFDACRCLRYLSFLFRLLVQRSFWHIALKLHWSKITLGIDGILIIFYYITACMGTVKDIGFSIHMRCLHGKQTGYGFIDSSTIWILIIWIFQLFINIDDDINFDFVAVESVFVRWICFPLNLYTASRGGQDIGSVERRFFFLFLCCLNQKSFRRYRIAGATHDTRYFVAQKQKKDRAAFYFSFASSCRYCSIEEFFNNKNRHLDTSVSV